MTGRPPFQAANVMETLKQVLEREPVPPRYLNPDVDRELETICLKCLDKDPARRYASAAALAEELTQFLQNEPICARPIGRAARLWRWCRRRAGVAGLTAIALASLIAAIPWEKLYKVLENEGKKILDGDGPVHPTQNSARSLYLWELFPARTFQGEEWRRLAQLLSMRRIDEAGNLESLPPKESAALWAALHAE